MEELMVPRALAAFTSPQAARGLLRLEWKFLQGLVKATLCINCSKLDDSELSSYAAQQGAHKFVELLTSAANQVRAVIEYQLSSASQANPFPFPSLAACCGGVRQAPCFSTQ
jgi:hypothetical protein